MLFFVLLNIIVQIIDMLFANLDLKCENGYNKKEFSGGIIMSPVQIQKRKRAIKIADAVNKIEGVPVSNYANELAELWANGIISATQMKELLIQMHRKV